MTARGLHSLNDGILAFDVENTKDLLFHLACRMDGQFYRDNKTRTKTDNNVTEILQNLLKSYQTFEAV